MPKKKGGNFWLNYLCIAPGWREKIGDIMTAYRAYTAIANTIHHPRHKVFQAMFVLFLPYLSSWEKEQSFFFNATCLDGTKCTFGWLTITQPQLACTIISATLCEEATEMAALYDWASQPIRLWQWQRGLSRHVTSPSLFLFPSLAVPLVFFLSLSPCLSLCVSDPTLR